MKSKKENSIWFDIYLNGDLFMHVYTFTDLNDIRETYELLGYKVAIRVVGNKNLGSFDKLIYTTKLSADTVNDSAFL